MSVTNHTLSSDASADAGPALAARVRLPKTMQLRFAGLYICLYAFFGVSSPFMPLWFKDHGFSGTVIGAMLAAPLIARVVTAPPMAWFGRRYGPRLAVLGLAFIGAVGVIALWASTAAWMRMLSWFVVSSALAACSPLLDVCALGAAAQRGFAFGRLRGAGSLAYVATSLVAGVLITTFGSNVIMIWLICACISVAIGAQCVLASNPDAPPASSSQNVEPRWNSNRLKLVWVGAICGLIMASHGFYALAPIVWRGQGLSPTVCGALWIVGVFSDFLILFFGEPIRARIAPERMLVLGALTAIARWTLYSTSPSVPLIIVGQAMHAFSLTSVLLASLHLTQRFSSDNGLLVNQAANWGLSTGLFLGASQLVSGWLYDHFHAVGYLVMVIPAALALLLAIGLAATCNVSATPRCVERLDRAAQ